MPRPGPRPYECVRRAWHSDRHQPVRGSIIQEIFRVVNEVHSPTTRKNKEWQEKLPVVVLKAEEIMYSKANSEAEYVDLNTLWNRSNDAIDTIIRRDDTPECGNYLQPCIEAALNLGCIPRRASRSQRHSNPGFFLGSGMKEATATSPNIPDSSNDRLGSSTRFLPSPPPHPSNIPGSSSQFASWYSTSAAPTTISSSCPNVASINPTTSHEHKDSNHDCPFFSKDYLLPNQDGSLPILMSYSDNQPKAGSQQTLSNHQDPSSSILTATWPCVPYIIREAETSLLHNFLGCNTTTDTSDRSSNFGVTSKNQPNTGCDLSLRLGLPSPLSISSQAAWTHEGEDVGSSDSCDGSKFGDLWPSRARAINFESSFSSPKDKGFDLRHIVTDEPLESFSS